MIGFDDQMITLKLEQIAAVKKLTAGIQYTEKFKQIVASIKVVGIVAKNDALANQNGLYNEGSTTGVGYLTIEAQKIKDVYGNCSESGKEWEGDHEGK